MIKEGLWLVCYKAVLVGWTGAVLIEDEASCFMRIGANTDEFKLSETLKEQNESTNKIIITNMVRLGELKDE